MNNKRLKQHLTEDLWELAGVYASISTTSAENFLNNVIEELKRRGEINDSQEEQARDAIKEIHKKQLLRHNVQQYIAEVRKSFK